MIVALVPSHSFAAWLIATIDRLLDMLGLSKDPAVEEFIYIIVIVGIAVLIGWVLRHVLLYVAQKYVQIRKGEVGKEILQHKILQRTSHLIPPLVILAWIPFAFDTGSFWLTAFERFLIIYTIIVVVMAVCAIFDFIWTRYDQRGNNRNLPLKGILNSAKGVVWIIGVIIAVSVAVDKSPASLLAGLGAFAAALMLIFKNSILGFVAGIQLSQNDMLHVGDWIVVPSTIANGIVMDVSLTAVKVRNWDNTIVTLPPYTLVSESFQNWRGMTMSGVRQIARTITFVTTSVKAADSDYLDRVVKRVPTLESFVSKIKGAGGKPEYDPGLTVVNGTIDTNLGLLRAYLCEYLINNAMISKDFQILVRTMQPTEAGIPLQLWCYVASTKWTEYEAVQSAIFEHLAAIAPAFELRLFNDSGDNTVTSVQMLPTQAPAASPAPVAPATPAQ